MTVKDGDDVPHPLENPIIYGFAKVVILPIVLTIGTIALIEGARYLLGLIGL